MKNECARKARETPSLIAITVTLATFPAAAFFWLYASRR